MGQGRQGWGGEAAGAIWKLGRGACPEVRGTVVLDTRSDSHRNLGPTRTASGTAVYSSFGVSPK